MANGITDFADVTLREDGPSFEKFDVEKNDQARILIPTTKLATTHIHVFHREPPEMVENDKGRMVPRYSRESFAGTYICLGDFTKVAGNPRFGDPDNCPACRLMNESEVALVEPPRKQYALNVIQYSTKHRDYLTLRNNNVEVKIWRHGDDKKITPIKTVAAQTKITSVDFLIAADNSDWKKYEIQPAQGKPLYTTEPALKEAVSAAIKDELYDDEALMKACGKQLSEPELEAEIKQLFQSYQGLSSGGSHVERVAVSNGSGATAVAEELVAVAAGGVESAELDDIDTEDLQSLLDD
jgi:hypothetical protein